MNFKNYKNSILNIEILKKIIKKDGLFLKEKQSKFIININEPEKIINVYESYLFYIPAKLKSYKGVLKVFMNKYYELDFMFVYLKDNFTIDYLTNKEKNIIFEIIEINEEIKGIILGEMTQESLKIKGVFDKYKEINIKVIGRNALKKFEVKSGIKNKFTIYTNSSIFYIDFCEKPYFLYESLIINNILILHSLNLIYQVENDIEGFKETILNNKNNYDYLYKFIEDNRIDNLFNAYVIKEIIMNREKKIVVEEENGESYETTLGALVNKYSSKTYIIVINYDGNIKIKNTEGMHSLIPCKFYEGYIDKTNLALGIFINKNTKGFILKDIYIRDFNPEEYYDLDDKKNINKEEVLNLFRDSWLNKGQCNLIIDDAVNRSLMEKNMNNKYQLNLEKKNIFILKNILIHYYSLYFDSILDYSIKEREIKKIKIISQDKEGNAFYFLLYVVIGDKYVFFDEKFTYEVFPYDDLWCYEEYVLRSEDIDILELKRKEKKENKILKYMDRILKKYKN